MTLKKTTPLLACLSMYLLLPGVSVAEDKFPTRINACVSCHGPVGISVFDLWPNIAGQKRAYLVNQLKAFREGNRYDPWMTPMAVPLSDTEIEELAEFYSKL